MQGFKLLWTPLGLVAGLLAVAVTAVLGLIAWRRSGYARSTGLLETLRLAIVCLVAITLNQPEWIEQFQPERRPTLVVLHDESASMGTCDVYDATEPTAEPKTRLDSLAPYLDVNAWDRVAEKWDIVFEPFSSDLPDPATGTNLFAALDRLPRAHENLRAVVLLSDGDWNVGPSPARAASRLRVRNVPVLALPIGSPSRLPDIELVRIDAPTFAVVHKPIRIPFVIDSALPRDYSVEVTLASDSGETISKQVTIPAMHRLEDVLIWTPTQTGEFQLTLTVPIDQKELITTNNQRRVPISVRQETIKVLLVESTPRWEYRYLRNALERDPGVDVSCLLFHPGLGKVGGGRGYLSAFPATLDELAKYDVVFLGDVGIGPKQLTVEQCNLIKGLVQSQASGLILMPGMRGGQHSLIGTELDELYPVVLDEAQRRGFGSRTPTPLELTETGRRSLLTKLEDKDTDNARRWESLPGFYWYAPVVRAKAGTEVLAVHASQSSGYGRVPLLVTKTFGTGKVLFMGTDGAWRWREGVEDKYHYRFWGQVARWMAYQRSMAQGETMRLFYSPDRPQQGHRVTLNANVMSGTGEPLQEGHVSVLVTTPSGKTQTIRLVGSGDQWGLFTGWLETKEAGDYALTLRCRENGSTLETKLPVQAVSREKRGQPVRTDVLDEIASITGGRLLETVEFETLLDEIAALPEPEPIVHRLRIWCHPLWVGLLIALLGLFWTGRKMVGTV